MTELTDTYDKINEELNKSGDNYTKAARTVICTEVCGHMFEQGFTLDQVRGTIESEIGIDRALQSEGCFLSEGQEAGTKKEFNNS